MSCGFAFELMLLGVQKVVQISCVLARLHMYSDYLALQCVELCYILNCIKFLFCGCLLGFTVL